MRHDLSTVEHTMQNSTSESTEFVSALSSTSDDDTGKDTTVPGCVIHDHSLLRESEYVLSPTVGTRLPGRNYELDTVMTGTKRKLQISDTVASTCGYDSDTEQEDTLLERTRKRIKNNKCRVQQTTANYLSHGQKRKCNSEWSVCQRRKRHKPVSTTERIIPCAFVASSSIASDSSYSSSDFSSDSSSGSRSDSSSCSSSDSISKSSSDSTTSSDCSDSEHEILNDESDVRSRTVRKYLKPIRRIIPCPDTCVCVAGQSRPPVRIDRGSHLVVQPLYKKLLQRRLLSFTNTVLSTCCNRRCYQKWARKRISMYRMFRDYDKTDLRVDHFSWGQWKPEPESDEESSSDEDDWVW